MPYLCLVGNHETLLAYLVRRLLENGANTSFVNRIADKTLKVEDLISLQFMIFVMQLNLKVRLV